MDRAERHYGMITVTVEAEPIMGVPPAWANVIEIADEAIELVIRRNKEETAQRTQHEEKIDGTV